MNITAIAKQGQGDEFVIRLTDVEAQFMLAALLRRYPDAMCNAIMDMVNTTPLEDLPRVEVEAVATEKGLNLPIDKFCLDAAIRLLTAKRSVVQDREE